MANADAPFGLRPIRHYQGGVVRPNEYTIASAYGTNIFTGDPVKSSGTTKGIIIGTAGGVILGVFAGCSYTDAAGSIHYSPYWPASTALLTGTVAKALVYDDPNILFAVQAATSQDVDAVDVGLLADLASGTGSTTTGQSGWELGGHDGSEAQCKIIGLHDKPANAYGANAVVEVLIMEHELRGGGTEV